MTLIEMFQNVIKREAKESHTYYEEVKYATHPHVVNIDGQLDLENSIKDVLAQLQETLK